eukprot:FR737845.1.p4 GENE.FR737845.1~~FR737845.1.p4  ORF type:complete len:125 (+),score=50.81 FR737845.1:868-1242(+)
MNPGTGSIREQAGPRGTNTLGLNSCWFWAPPFLRPVPPPVGWVPSLTRAFGVVPCPTDQISPVTPSPPKKRRSPNFLAGEGGGRGNPPGGGPLSGGPGETPTFPTNPPSFFPPPPPPPNSLCCI